MAQQIFSTQADMIWMVTEENVFSDEIILDYHSLVRIISGEMKIKQADKSYIFRAGETVLFSRDQLSAVVKQPRDGEAYKALVLALEPYRLKDFYEAQKIQHSTIPDYRLRVFGRHSLLESFFASVIPYFDLQHQLPETIASLKVAEAISIIRFLDATVDGMLANFSEPGKIDLVEFMEKHYMLNMPLDKFGKLTGRSLSTFTRDFKRTFKVTPQRWLTQKRLRLAHYELTQRNRKAVDVYLDTGFENLSHFSYAFKKEFGYSPNQLKEQTVQV